jgi:electron transport complex protein RnfA
MADRTPSRLARVAPALAPLALVALFALPVLRPAVPAAGADGGDNAIVSARVVGGEQVVIRLRAPLANTTPGNFRFTEAAAPDAPIPVRSVSAEGVTVTLALEPGLRPAEHYRLTIAEPPLTRAVAPPLWATLVTVFLSSALINNFVFTRYLGLCIFFGVSKRRETAVGMGITFTAVMIGTAMLSWVVDTFALRPLHLSFLQVLVFIGTVAAMVQFLDTMLKKTHPALHKSFGVYLMLITTNCIILAVPLLNAESHATAAEAFALSLGSGLGFALALFLMSCAREKMELARVPRPFEGLPIAFALAGLFALAFMGFSGLDFFR